MEGRGIIEEVRGRRKPMKSEADEDREDVQGILEKLQKNLEHVRDIQVQ